MNGFTRHGIAHSSASSINLWSKAPDVYIAQKLFGMKSEMGASAHRGTAIEYGIVKALTGECDVATAIDMAHTQYDALTALSKGDTGKERETIAPSIELGLEVLKPYGEPHFETADKQNKVELLCRGDGWDLPLIGYLDLCYPQHNLIIDIKTTGRMPSVMSMEHQRQAAIYAKGSKMDVKFLYITPKKTQFLECEDVAGTLAEIKDILNRQERFLRLGDKDMLAGIVHYDPSTFYWNGQACNPADWGKSVKKRLNL